MKLLNKKGDIAWEYIAAIIITLVVIMIIVIMTTGLKDKIIESFVNFGSTGLGR